MTRANLIVGWRKEPFWFSVAETFRHGKSLILPIRRKRWWTFRMFLAHPARRTTLAVRMARSTWRILRGQER